MDSEGTPANRLAGELDTLRKQIAELKGAMLSTPLSAAARPQGAEASRRVVDRLTAEIESQLGFVPPFFAFVAEMPEVFASLWQQMRFSYLNNPLPSLIKEKLFARLSCFCPVSYAVVAHSCSLRHLGVQADEILRWLKRPVPSELEHLEVFFERFSAASKPLSSWPEPGTPLEEGLLGCSMHMFLNPGRSARCRDELVRLIGVASFARLTAFLGYVKMHHHWLESYPEPVQEKDATIRVNLAPMLEEEPRLAPFFRSYFEPKPAPVQPAAAPEEIREERTEARPGIEGKILGRLLKDSQDGIFTFDRELNCMLWNPSMERIFGIRKEDAVGRVLFDVLPFLTETGADKNLLEALRGETVVVKNCPFRIPQLDREGYYDAQFIPLADGEENIHGGIAIIRDITDRVHAEEDRHATEERYRELFENAHDIVFTHDLTGRLTSLNKAAERITGYSRAEALQMNAGHLVAPEQLKTACKMLERHVAGENPGPYELEIISRDGRRVALEISTHIISREGKPAGVQGIARDVTERKRTEEALQQAKLNLESWVHELEQRTREMTLLSELGDMLRACLTTEEAYTVIVRVAQQIFPVQAGALYVIAPAHDQVDAVAVWGDASRVERVFAPDECWALRRGRVHWVEDASLGLICRHHSQSPPGSYLCVPMMAQSEALGVLYLTQPANSRLTEAKQRLALAMAEQIAMALSNLKLHETLRSQSIRDPVTGLFNRRFMEESLELELRRAARNRRPLGIIMLEVDNFQGLSQSIGGDVENSVLRELGSLLQTIIRKEDIASRFGSERFAIILPQGSLEVTSQRAENLREMIKNLEIRHRGRAVGPITTSAGVAGFPDHGRTGETLIRAADSALQRAQQEGGDRVATAT